MENIKTLTPLQIWQDYNPIKEPLELNIIGRSDDGEVETTEYAFTAIYAKDGRVRTPVKVRRLLGANNAPVYLYIKGYYDTKPRNFDELIKSGFAVVEYDYSGKLSGKARYTKYPKSLEYGNVQLAQERLNTATYGARETSLHLWVIVTRRVLTLIGAINNLDENNICSVAYGDAANIMWQTAGIDGRINTIAPIINFGYSEYSGYNKYGKNNAPEYDEERIRWNTGCSVQAYAKFVSSDVLCVAASNDKKYSIDRLWDTMSLISNTAQHRELVCFGLDGQIFNSSIDVITQFLKDKFIMKRAIAISPKISLRVTDGKLACDISCDSSYDTIVAAELYCAYDEPSSAYRSWTSQSLGIDIQGKANAIVRVYDSKALLFCIANVKYKNGMQLSSELKVVTPNSLGEIKENVKATRIIYEKKMGIKAFAVRTSELSVKDDAISVGVGPLDITGILTNSGSLVNYNIGDVKCEEAESLLQIDLYSKTKKSVAITLIDCLGKEYYATINLVEGEEWTRAQLSPSDLKDINFIALKEWADIKCLVINKAEGIMVNNIIWV